MKVTQMDGKDLKKGTKFVQIENNKIVFYKVIDFATSKPGKHGSAKKVVTSTNLLTGRSNQQTFLGGSNVYHIDDWEYTLYPIYMVDNEFREFTYDLEQELSISINHLDLTAKEMISWFRQSNINKTADELLTNENGDRLVFLITDVKIEDKENKFLWDITYLPDDALDKKLAPGSFYEQWMLKQAGATTK